MKKPTIVKQVVDAVDGPPIDGEPKLITDIRKLVEALEEGGYDATPSKLEDGCATTTSRPHRKPR